MFREIARKKQAISREACIEILKNEPRGVLSVLGDNDYPYGMPINQFYNEEDGCLYFHTGKKGHRTDAVLKHSKASFCTYDKGFRKDGEWALNINSVIVFGTIQFVEDADEAIEITRKLSYKFTQDETYIETEIKKFAKNVLVLKLVPEHITGKLVNEA